MTRTERQEDKKLYEEAKEMEKKSKGIFFIQSKGSSRSQEDHKITKRVKNIGNRNCTDVNNNVNSFHVLNYLNCFLYKCGPVPK